MINLDLCFNGKLEKDQNIIFNRLANKNVKNFLNFIDKISSDNKNNIDWWVSSVCGRNIFQSPIFHFFCCFILVDYYLKKKIKIKYIIVDSLSFKNILEIYFKKNKIYIKIYYKKLRNFNFIFRKYLKIFFIFINYFYKFQISKITKNLLVKFQQKI